MKLDPLQLVWLHESKDRQQSSSPGEEESGEKYTPDDIVLRGTLLYGFMVAIVVSE
jgi:hypothetical protein